MCLKKRPHPSVKEGWITPYYTGVTAARAWQVIVGARTCQALFLCLDLKPSINWSIVYNKKTHPSKKRVGKLLLFPESDSRPGLTGDCLAQGPVRPFTGTCPESPALPRKWCRIFNMRWASYSPFIILNGIKQKSRTILFSFLSGSPAIRSSRTRGFPALDYSGCGFFCYLFKNKILIT